jgi:hypothetical protein
LQQFAEIFAANPKNPLSDVAGASGTSLKKERVVSFLEFKTGGGGAWESNPPSTRKLAEQPF